MSVLARTDSAPCALCAALLRIAGGALPVLAGVLVTLPGWLQSVTLGRMGMNA